MCWHVCLTLVGELAGRRLSSAAASLKPARHTLFSWAWIRFVSPASKAHQPNGWPHRLQMEHRRDAAAERQRRAALTSAGLNARDADVRVDYSFEPDLMDRPESDDPFLIALTEDERLHGLDLSRTNLCGRNRPDRRPRRTSAHCARRAHRLRNRRPRDTTGTTARTSESTTRAPRPGVRRYGSCHCGSCARRGARGVRRHGSPDAAPDGQPAALHDRIAERTEAVTHMPSRRHSPKCSSRRQSRGARAGVAVTLRPVTIPRQTGQKSAALRAPARSAPPVSSKPKAPPVRRDSPIRTASVSSRRTAEPAPTREPAGAPLLASPTLPASLAAQPSPAAAVPAALPRAEASAAVFSRCRPARTWSAAPVACGAHCLPVCW
jgi:hypothetical protein